MTQPSVALYLSRHPMPDELPLALPGYTFRHVKRRWRSLDDLRKGLFAASGQHPAFVFYVLPYAWQQGFLHYCAVKLPGTLLIRVGTAAHGDGRAGGLIYERTWLAGNQIHAETWIPVKETL